MEYFPAFLRLEGRRCLVVGGGAVAARKLRLLMQAGASVVVVSPTVAPQTQALVERHDIDWRARKFTVSDLAGCWLVIDATGIETIGRHISDQAEAAGIFFNSVDNPSSCSFLTPAIVDRGPVVVAVSSGGAAPVLARRIRARIESLLPAGLGALAQIAGAWRDRVSARFDDLVERRRFWERFFDSAVTADARETEAIMKSLLDTRQESGGEAWLVGAGPGDPDLLTLAATHCMQAADVIVHDRLVSDDVLALARRDAERIPVGKIPGSRKNSQEAINALLVGLVSAGKRVCRLKGGDPFIFGRGGEEARALQRAGLRYRIVPGITAAAGCAAAAGIPLTHREAAQSVVFLTAHGSESVDTMDWASLSRDRQTLAFYMGVRRFPAIMNKLIGNGRRADTPIAIVERGTTRRQRVVRGTLGQLTLLAEAHDIEAPAMLFVGDVVRFGAVPGGLEPAIIEPSRDAIPAKSAIHRTANRK